MQCDRALCCDGSLQEHIACEMGLNVRRERFEGIELHFEIRNIHLPNPVSVLKRCVLSFDVLTLSLKS
jgi:hypothetical protein